jgi:hypothetical protein
MFAALMLVLASLVSAFAQDSSPSGPTADTAGELKPQTPDTDLFALMTGTCNTLKIAGRDFVCHTVAYAHSVQGRAYFTIAVDDPADPNHIISFSGENCVR